MRIPPLTTVLRSGAGDWAFRSLVSALANCRISTTYGCIRSLPVAAFAVDAGFIGSRVVKVTNWLHTVAVNKQLTLCRRQDFLFLGITGGFEKISFTHPHPSKPPDTWNRFSPLFLVALGLPSKSFQRLSLLTPKHRFCSTFQAIRALPVWCMHKSNMCLKRRAHLPETYFPALRADSAHRLPYRTYAYPPWPWTKFRSRMPKNKLIVGQMLSTSVSSVSNFITHLKLKHC